MRRPFALAAVLAGACLVARPAGAVRPFITDDARVVGAKLFQVESWVRFDKGSLQHWIVPAIGPSNWAELSIGAVHGVSAEPKPAHYALAAPLLQAKLLLHTTVGTEIPGMAIILGTFLPFGFGGFKSPPSGFAYFAMTQDFFNEDLLIHANVGMAGASFQETRDDDPSPAVVRRNRFRAMWGVGTQIHLYKSVHYVGELFSGDPYAEVSGIATQNGFRFVIDDQVQLDSTCGVGISGTPSIPFWLSAGLRLVSKPLW